MRTRSACVRPHVPMLYVSTGITNDAYSRRRSCRLICARRNHTVDSLRKATLASCLRLATSSKVSSILLPDSAYSCHDFQGGGFTDENVVAIVPSSWLDGNSCCLWPPYASSIKNRKAAQKQEEAHDDWKSFPSSWEGRLHCCTHFYEDIQSSEYF